MSQLRALQYLKQSKEVYIWLKKDGTSRIRVVVLPEITSFFNTNKLYEFSLTIELPDNFDFNKAIVDLYGYVDYLGTLGKIPKEAFENLLLLMSPFTPHLCEELWSKLGNKEFISLAKWPKFDKSKVSEKIEEEEQLTENIGKLGKSAKFEVNTQNKNIKGLIITWELNHLNI